VVPDERDVCLGLPVLPMLGATGYSLVPAQTHVRAGAHDVVEYDWERSMDFADAQLGR
jgi:hypothetical protein